METTAEVPSVEDRKSKVLAEVSWESLRLLAHKYKAIAAWFKRQAGEVSQAVQGISLVNYKPESPLATMKYCVDKVYHIASKLLEETCVHPVFANTRGYTRHVAPVYDGKRPFCIYRINEMPRPLAILYAHYAALLLALRSRAFNLLFANSNHNPSTYSQDSDSNGFWEGNISPLLRQHYRIMHTRTLAANHTIADSNALTVNRFAIEALSSTVYALEGDTQRRDLKNLDSSSARTTYASRIKHKNATNGLINGTSSRKESRDEMQSFALHCLRNVNALELDTPVKLYKHLSLLGTVFEQSMNGLISTPIFDSLSLAFGFSAEGLRGAFNGLQVQGNRDIYDILIPMLAYGPSSCSMDSHRPPSIWYQVQVKNVFPTSDILWSQQALTPITPLIQGAPSHIYRGISHVPALRRVARTHREGVSYFTGADWTALSSLPIYNVRNMTQALLLTNNEATTSFSTKRAVSSFKLSYVAMNDIDSVIKKMPASTESLDAMMPSNFFTLLLDTPSAKDFFGFSVDDIPSEDNIRQIAEWILKNCKYVTAIQVPILTMMANIYNSMSSYVEAGAHNKAIASSALRMISTVMQQLNDSYMLNTPGRTPGRLNGPGGDLRGLDISNWSMDGFHSIRASLHSFYNIPLSLDILGSKLRNLRRFMSYNARDIFTSAAEKTEPKDPTVVVPQESHFK